MRQQIDEKWRPAVLLRFSFKKNDIWKWKQADFETKIQVKTGFVEALSIHMKQSKWFPYKSCF